MDSNEKKEIGGLTYYSTMGIAEMLDTSRENVRYWTLALGMPFHRFGRTMWFEQSEVKNWLGPDNTVPCRNNRRQKTGWRK